MNENEVLMKLHYLKIQIEELMSIISTDLYGPIQQIKNDEEFKPYVR